LYLVLKLLQTWKEPTVPLELSIIPPQTKLESNADGQAFDISATSTRTFLCELTVTDQLEQESLDVSLWGSADGQEFGKKPYLKIPQQFYRGTTKMVLDLSLRPEVRFLRARWELNRWGRVAPTPMFVVGLTLTEIPPMSQDTPTKRAALAVS
jgi:hypothetical protein